MAVCNFEQQVDSIRRKLQQICSHQFLYKHIEPPELDVDQIHLMAYSLRDSNLSSEEREVYIIATMLANLALETHENVSNRNISMKARQLKVLAGDYYSGLYYNLLSEYRNIELIKSIASAIKTINEHKINLIQFKGENLNSYLQSVKKIESGLLEQFCHHFQIPIKYIEFFSEFLFLKRVGKELKWLVNGKFSFFLDGIKNIHIRNSKELSLEEEKKMLTDILNESRDKLDCMMKDLNVLPSIVHLRINELSDTLNGGC
ncbi:heptaprenyl diphosphate synthase component 1 [Lederbergia wuyishanensis]|uniref:Heptaprenyl diphosphate synthase n=1 Tax=Lederbergia wuyishanensis TaxID=1347903 RepID=A0ABU0D0Z7_9BACI|nr:heptaprenyl diphosphate synthase component 1 [Lederbergia wuyishanensis]MCJ8006678.1 heptaprenyl diphosphate synthase component 1 [Lederbergia wuyishanensis]MDQ0342060.1 heptaprenyl diphosphate synthase [Lederbergia wuyishanensis]